MGNGKVDRRPLIRLTAALVRHRNFHFAVSHFLRLGLRVRVRIRVVGNGEMGKGEVDPHRPSLSQTTTTVTTISQTIADFFVINRLGS